MKKKIVTILFILFIIAFVIFIANTTRKIIIIKDLQNKVAECEKKENIYVKLEGESAIAEKFIKDGIEKDIVKKKDSTVTLIQLMEEHERRMYIIAGEQKTLVVSKEEKNDLDSKVVSLLIQLLGKTFYMIVLCQRYTQKK